MIRHIVRRVAAAVLATAAACACAQDYPNKPIRLVIGSAPGGGTDAIGRAIAESLSGLLRQPVVPDNRVGASGQIASEYVAKSAPDGYTLLIAQNGHVTNPAFFRKLPYDTLKDFTPIAPLASSPLVLVAGTGSHVKTARDLVALGRQDAKALSFASAESSSRLAAEQLSDAAGLKTTSVPYKGTGPAITDLVGGHVNFSITTLASVLPFRDAGKLSFVGVLAGERSGFLPDVPTLAEQGLDVRARGWWAIFAPAGLPPAIVAQLSAAIRTGLATPQVRSRIQGLSADVWSGSPQELDAFVRAEMPAIQRLARKAGIEAE